MKSYFTFTTFFFALLLTSCVVMSARMHESTNGVLQLQPIVCNTNEDCAKFCKGPIHNCQFHTCACVPGNPNCC
ncbi:putative defensin-like protein 279 [Eutrema salsugineum]|uniref:putative defensin-like protein 279 n=1 Tax=Eutrema salsugineum TaxID=72664 RepID=UPI000CECF464|nr:putative defensin-like protein 279 [Eutrema salsugineum]